MPLAPPSPARAPRGKFGRSAATVRVSSFTTKESPQRCGDAEKNVLCVSAVLRKKSTTISNTHVGRRDPRCAGHCPAPTSNQQDPNYMDFFRLSQQRTGQWPVSHMTIMVHLRALAIFSHDLRLRGEFFCCAIQFPVPRGLLRSTAAL